MAAAIAPPVAIVIAIVYLIYLLRKLNRTVCIVLAFVIGFATAALACAIYFLLCGTSTFDSIIEVDCASKVCGNGLFFCAEQGNSTLLAADGGGQTHCGEECFGETTMVAEFIDAATDVVERKRVPSNTLTTLMQAQVCLGTCSGSVGQNATIDPGDECLPIQTRQSSAGLVWVIVIMSLLLYCLSMIGLVWSFHFFHDLHDSHADGHGGEDSWVHLNDLDQKSHSFESFRSIDDESR